LNSLVNGISFTLNASNGRERTTENEGVEKINVTKLACLSGFVGSSVMVTGALVAAIPYRGGGGETYSILNHYISELGEVDVSTLSVAFNSGMIVGGCFMVVFMTALGTYVKSRLGWLASSAGIFSGLACGLIGVFPMNGFFTHAAVAYSFFYSGLIAVLLFIIVILCDRDRKVAKWLLIPGVACVTSFASFLMVPHLAQPLSTLAFRSGARPRIWPVAVFEWSVFLSVIVWILLVSIYLAARRPFLGSTGAHRGPAPEQDSDPATR
jgi:hypothetical membrane protein